MEIYIEDTVPIAIVNGFGVRVELYPRVIDEDVDIPSPLINFCDRPPTEARIGDITSDS